LGRCGSGHCPVKLFLSATNVRTVKIKVFQNDEIGPEAVLASACLPFIFQAVEIDGEHYWDGGTWAIRRLLADARDARDRLRHQADR
jgi:predicted acylesterase/phospholipase RssA